MTCVNFFLIAFAKKTSMIIKFASQQEFAAVTMQNSVSLLQDQFQSNARQLQTEQRVLCGLEYRFNDTLRQTLWFLNMKRFIALLVKHAPEKMYKMDEKLRNLCSKISITFVKLHNLHFPKVHTTSANTRYICTRMATIL